MAWRGVSLLSLWTWVRPGHRSRGKVYRRPAVTEKHCNFCRPSDSRLQTIKRRTQPGSAGVQRMILRGHHGLSLASQTGFEPRVAIQIEMCLGTLFRITRFTTRDVLRVAARLPFFSSVSHHGQRRRSNEAVLRTVTLKEMLVVESQAWLRIDDNAFELEGRVDRW